MTTITRIRPHKGPQTKFLKSNADIAIYGGAAGGGKSYALLLEPLRHISKRGFQGVIFRRTSEQVRQAGGLWDEASGLYPLVGGKGRENTLDWRWKAGATIRFEHLQHESTKYEQHGSQICYLAFDELTHFTETQFFYMLSRNRSTCGVRPYVRCTCNPDARSWVAQLIAWWIDQDSGYAIPERSGVKRWFAKVNDKLEWSNSKAELAERLAGSDVRPLSLTFIPAKLDDNPTADPEYRSRLMALSRVERERLLGANWKVSEDAIIDGSWINRYSMNGDMVDCTVAGRRWLLEPTTLRRFATIDTAGTSREKAEELKGSRDPSWTVVAIWDHHHQSDLLVLRHIWRARVGWNELKEQALTVLRAWRVPRAYVENAHYGQALVAELPGIQTELVGPVLGGMAESHRGAKLERAIASGLLSRLENGLLAIPREESPWVRAYMNELVGWGGLPKEAADQIDVSSYACHAARKQVSSWGGVIKIGGLSRV